MKLNRKNEVKVVITRVSNDVETLRLLSKFSGFTVDELDRALMYNIVSVISYSLITGYGRPKVELMCRGRINKGEIVYDLNVCYPFACGTHLGAKFIYRDKKFDEVLKARIEELMAAQEAVPAEIEG